MQAAKKLTTILRAELAFLERGGYRRSPPCSWRPNFVFEDSPTCINFCATEEPKPCAECSLIEFVPQNLRETRFPCRHIQLTERGETVRTFYEWGTQEELEAALRAWLKRTIRELETGEKVQTQKAGNSQA